MFRVRVWGVNVTRPREEFFYAPDCLAKMRAAIISAEAKIFLMNIDLVKY